MIKLDTSDWWFVLDLAEKDPARAVWIIGASTDWDEFAIDFVVWMKKIATNALQTVLEYLLAALRDKKKPSKEPVVATELNSSDAILLHAAGNVYLALDGRMARYNMLYAAFVRCKELDRHEELMVLSYIRSKIFLAE